MLVDLEKWFAIHTLLFMIIVGGISGYWILFDEPPKTHVVSKLEKNIVTVYDNLVITREYCTEDSISKGIIHRRIVNHLVYQMPDTTSRSFPGFGVRKFIVEIPDYFMPGNYTYKASLEIKVNPLKTVTIDFEDLPFEIVKK